ncbi:MAG: hypothetical protein HY081_12040 [Gammaproteobacteria bacterium]|nr:hypothetical protein [Gammaproteobacteria bacterium]
MRNPSLTRTGKSALVFWLILALLFTQGMRVCLHAHDAIAPAPDHAHASSMHLESTLSAAADHEESAFDTDVSLSALLKAFYSSLAFAVVLAFGFFTPILLQLVRHRPSAEIWFPASALYSLTPPLRAPPR